MTHDSHHELAYEAVYRHVGSLTPYIGYTQERSLAVEVTFIHQCRMVELTGCSLLRQITPR